MLTVVIAELVNHSWSLQSTKVEEVYVLWESRKRPGVTQFLEWSAGYFLIHCCLLNTLAQMSSRHFITFNPLYDARNLLPSAMQALMQIRVYFYGFN